MPKVSSSAARYPYPNESAWKDPRTAHPEIPGCREAYRILCQNHVQSLSCKTPARLELITEVGPPDCPTIMFRIPITQILLNTLFRCRHIIFPSSDPGRCLRIAPLQSNSRNSINHYNIKAERLTRFFLLFV